MTEPVVDPQYFRYTIKPINSKFQKIWDLYLKQQEVFWTAAEIKYSQADVDDFESLKPEEQYFLKKEKVLTIRIQE